MHSRHFASAYIELDEFQSNGEGEEAIPVKIMSIGRRELVLPPPFTLVTLREAGDAFAHARAIAGEAGAGTLGGRRGFDLVDCAVVLEPAEPLALARLAFYPAMNALADAVAAHCAPEHPLTFDWPGGIRLDGVLVGDGRLAWPEDARDAAVPDWLVFGARLRIATLDGPEAAGGELGIDAVGGLEGDAESFVESFARHLMANLHGFSEDRGASQVSHYVERLAPSDSGDSSFAIDVNGDLLVTTDRGRRRRLFVEALARQGERDAEGRLPA